MTIQSVDKSLGFSVFLPEKANWKAADFGL